MSHHAQVEEVSDSDPEEIAPDDSFAQDSIIAPAAVPASGPSKPTPSPASMPTPMPEPQREIPRHFQCLYPVYFDKTRSRAEGRKVGSELAVENPLAREIADAVQLLGFKVGLEPEKLHPKDWANPGRVRVLLKNEDGKLVNPKIKNSASVPVPPPYPRSPHPRQAPLCPPAPRGWKIGTILPIHSPAYSGGGVTDNPFKEAMAEMQGMPGMPSIPGMPEMPGMPGLSGEPSGSGAEKKKKDKKKGKA
ncbi:signal recognition particle 19 kDa protein [Penicillium alfredii]|uniref:Signal recognition particle 19 kDa protein n=1 Tax=Penicillium alfredii TaxID=1506179 RepID=A0A9W9KQP7_9EURO|nr:signal recognition particle 19 kDa protein [Penicillium alfredii]KAJ5114298.1 signal recognition particle 19 kDa protein [Penicillium alfredii]